MKKSIGFRKNIAAAGYLSSVCVLSFLGGFYFLGTRGVWFLALGIIVLLKQFFAKEIRLSLPLILTIAFSTMLFGFRTAYSSFEFAYFVAYAIIPVVMFLLGRESSKAKTEWIAIIVSLALGHVAFAASNVIYTLNSGYPIEPNFGLVTYFNFWTSKPQPRTFFSIDTTIIMALGAALLIKPGQGRIWFLRILGGLLIVAYFVSAAILGIRSPIVIAPSVLLVVALYSIFKETNRKKRYISLSIFGGLFLFFGVFCFLSAANVFGLKDHLMSIPGFNRFITEGGENEGRVQHYVVFSEHWLEYPWGGMYQAELLGKDWLGNTMFFHNGFLQIYTHGGFLLTLVASMLLTLLFRQIVLIGRNVKNETPLTLAVSIIVSFFAIFMIEPMITSGPFICSYLFLAGGYLAGQLTKQKTEKPFFLLGLNDWGGPSSASFTNLIEVAFIVLFGIGGGALVSITSGNTFYAVLTLASSVLIFLLFDKGQYNVVSWTKTGVAFVFAVAIVILEFWLFPNPSLLFSIVKVEIGLFSFLLLRVLVIQKRDPEDGYRAIRNVFIRISKDASLSEEDLVN